jgi:uncharacterized protein (TIGR00296 family)
LVKLARKTIKDELGIGEKIAFEEYPKNLYEKCGVFVTINKKTNNKYNLRGCIGYPFPIKPLIKAVKETSIKAAFNDPRFPPVSIKEINEIILEVSVLTPPKMISIQKPRQYPEKIQIGRDGLIVGRGNRRGLLLPQVALDWGWDSTEFLTQCCLKAGLTPDSWLLHDTEVLTFEAIIFEETEPNGEIKRHILKE